MKLSSFQYSIRDALRSLWRNKFMSLASIITVAISLLILGCAWLLVVNTQYMAGAMESELEINAYLVMDMERDKAIGIKEDIQALNGVAEVIFVPKEEGLKGLESRFGKDTDLLKALGDENPLPDMYRIKGNVANLVPQLAEEIGRIPGVEDVRYGQGMVEKLLSLTNWLRNVGMITIFAIGIAAVFLIATTIRITVFARRREIGIMKLVGATNWYIRWPFFLEGMIIGLTGALIAVLALNMFYGRLVSSVALTLSFLPLVSDNTLLFGIYRNLLLMGTMLGALGSAISLRRFLKV